LIIFLSVARLRLYFYEEEKFMSINFYRILDSLRIFCITRCHHFRNGGLTTHAGPVTPLVFALAVPKKIGRINQPPVLQIRKICLGLCSVRRRPYSASRDFGPTEKERSSNRRVQPAGRCSIADHKHPRPLSRMDHSCVYLLRIIGNGINYSTVCYR
jgi:hypothetical protein